MSLSYLSAPTMLAATAPWTDPSRDRPTLEAYPELSGHLAMLDRARKGLLDTQYDDGEVSAKIEELTAKITQYDVDHDRNARAVHGFMTSLAERANDPAERAAWLRRRNKLFPDALSINSASYLDEAGNADQVRARMTPELRKALEETVIDEVPLSETVDAWLDAGEKLGITLTQRSRLQNADDDARISAADVQQARFFWIKAVDSFVNFLDMIDMDDETRENLLSPLEDAIRDAAQQRARSADEDVVDEDAPVDEDVTDEDAPVDEEDVADDDQNDDGDDDVVVENETVAEEPA